MYISVCRIHYDQKTGPIGEISTKIIPLSDTKSPGYPVDKKIDCTWEIDAPRHTKVYFHKFNQMFHKYMVIEINTVRTIPTSNWKIIETEVKWIPLTHIYILPLTLKQICWHILPTEHVSKQVNKVT